MKKRLTRYLFWTILIVTLVVGILCWKIPALTFEQHPIATLFGGAALIVAIILSSITLYKYRPGMNTATKTMQGRWMLVPLLAIICFAAFSIFITAPEGLDVKWLSSTGAVFVIAMAAITVGGFLLTVTRLEEIHGRILNYSHLVERLDALIDMEHARIDQKGKNNLGRLYILANAPAIGNISATNEFDQCWPRLRGLLSNPQVSVKIACLSWEEDFRGTSAIHRFYYEHWGSGLVTKTELDYRIEQSLKIIDIVRKAVPNVTSLASKENRTNDQTKELFRLKDTIHEVPFHLFLTSERAILFTALSFPDYTSDAVDNGTIITNDERREVKVIGFETGDRSIINALKKGFERRLHKIAIQDRDTVSISSHHPGQAPPTDEPCQINVNNARTISGLIRHAKKDERWALICRGLTGNFVRPSSLDDLAYALEKDNWSSLRFDYGNSLMPVGGEQLRTIPTMLEDFLAAISYLSGDPIKQLPRAVIARGFGVRVALEGLVGYPEVPLIMWAPILWLRTSFELRARLHEFRRHNRIEVDGTDISEDFVDTLNDPTDDQVTQWIKPNRRHIIIQAEDDDVAPLRFGLEAKELIKSAGGNVEIVTVLGAHPHPATDVAIQIRKIRKILADL